jgi:hypothetical protein
MFDKELNILVNKNWNENERRIITTFSDNLKYYKKFIPNSLKGDILSAINMCITLKDQFEDYKNNCSCLTGVVGVEPPNVSIEHTENIIDPVEPKGTVDPLAQNEPKGAVLDETIKKPPGIYRFW